MKKLTNKLQIHIHSSFTFSFLLFFPHILSIIVLALVPLPLVVALILAVLVIISLYVASRKHLSWSGGQHTIIEINGYPDGTWTLREKGNQEIKCELQTDLSYSSTFMTILRFKLNDKRIRNVVLFPDAVGYEKYKKLVTYLRPIYE